MSQLLHFRTTENGTMSFLLTIQILRETNALLTDTWVGGLMWMMQKTVKMAKNTGLDQFQRQKAGLRSQIFQNGTQNCQKIQNDAFCITA